MTLPVLKGGVSSLDRKLLILRGFIPRQLCGDKKFTLKGGVLHPRIPIKTMSKGRLGANIGGMKGLLARKGL
jgi:hypothetical protein